jgi:hypothetical protein
VKASEGRWITSFTIPLLFSNNSLLARMLEIENAETFGSEMFGMFGFVFSVETTKSELLTSTFESITISMLLFSLPLPLELLLTFSTIE